MFSQERIGVCSWSLQPPDVVELIERVRGTGITQVQLWLNPLWESPDQWKNLVPRLAEAGIVLVSGMFTTVGEDYSTLESIRETGGLVPTRHWQKNQEVVEQAVEQSKRLGLRFLGSHVGFVPEDNSEPAYALLVQRVRWVADKLAAAGITLLCETGQETGEQLVEFLDAVDRKNVAVNFDPANIILYDKGDPVEACRVLFPYIRQVHLKDAVRTTTTGKWGSELPVGDGQVNWQAFLAHLEENGFRGHLMFEREAGTRRVADIRSGFEYLRRIGMIQEEMQ